MRDPAEREAFDQLCTLESSIARKLELLGIESLTPAERTVYAVWWLDAEVLNGGFSQYFFNSWGDFWESARTGLHEMGAHHTAGILAAAVSAFPEEPSANRETRQGQLQALSREQADRLDQATERYFHRTDDVESLLAGYSKARRMQLRE